MIIHHYNVGLIKLIELNRDNWMRFSDSGSFAGYVIQIMEQGKFKKNKKKEQIFKAWR